MPLNKKIVFPFILLFIVIAGAAVLQSKDIMRGIPACKGCNVIVISLDQVRANSLPCFGYAQNTAPNLCRFAARSHVFTNAYATASRTLDSHFSMVTSLYPSEHTMTLPYSSKLPSDVPTIASLMKKEGYVTYFFGPEGDPHLPLTMGLDRGFDKTFYADDPKSWMQTIDSLATPAGTLVQPVFFFMHTYMAHEPYMPDPEDLKLFYDGPDRKRMTYEELCRYTYTRLTDIHPELAVSPRIPTYCEKLDAYQEKNAQSFNDFNDMYTVFNDKYWHQFDDLPKSEKAKYTHALYIAQIHMLDTELGTFFTYLERKKLLDNTMIVIVGDQGDEFFEHDSYSHAWSLYNEVLHVPYIVYVPGSAPSRSDKLVSVVDIMPTVFQVLRKKLSVPVAGIGVFSSKTHHMVVAEHVSDGALALRTNAYTLIRRIVRGAFQLELFDIRTDPGEQINIFKDNSNVVESMLNEYKELKKSFPVYSRGSDPLPTWLKEEDKKRLLESGYF